MASYQLEGVTETLRSFDQAPKELLKIGKQAAAYAARQVSRDIKAGTPAEWRKLVGASAKQTKDGKLSASMGLYNQQGRQTKDKIPDWYKAYWSNYGTLEGRDPDHRFRTKVKHRATSAAKSRRNRTGLKAKNFFEGATRGWEQKFLSAFQEYLNNKKNEILK